AGSAGVPEPGCGALRTGGGQRDRAPHGRADRGADRGTSAAQRSIVAADTGATGRQPGAAGRRCSTEAAARLEIVVAVGVAGPGCVGRWRPGGQPAAAEAGAFGVGSGERRSPSWVGLVVQSKSKS